MTDSQEKRKRENRDFVIMEIFIKKKAVRRAWNEGEF